MLRIRQVGLMQMAFGGTEMPLQPCPRRADKDFTSWVDFPSFPPTDSCFTPGAAACEPEAVKFCTGIG